MNGPIEGGCQCGRVRYALARVPVAGAHLCHCRMCQKAVGNAFAALAPVRRDELTWIGAAPPDIFRSSSLAERGFCSHCGTPLTFAYIDSERINVTIGSLDDPAAVQPQAHEGVESLLPWEAQRRLADA